MESFRITAILRRWPTFVVSVYILAALSWTLPGDFFRPKPLIDSLSRGPLIFLNLWQAWDMFAPNPRSEDIWIDVVYKNRDGTQSHWALTKMIDMSYFDRWQRERWRKYFNDHLRLDSEKILWQPFAEYTVRHLRTRGLDPVSIELIRSWRRTEIPVRPDLRADQNNAPWSRYTFFRWQVPEGFDR